MTILPPSLLSLPSMIVTIVYIYDRLLLPWLVHMHLTVRFWWTKLNFLVLFAQCSKDQWICEIINYYVALPLQWFKFCLYPNIFWEGVVHWMLLGYTSWQVCTSPRNSTWFTGPFFLMREWGVGHETSDYRDLSVCVHIGSLVLAIGSLIMK